LVSPLSTTIKPAISAAVLLLAIELAHAAGAEVPSDVSQVLALTQASRSQAYEMRSRLAQVLCTIHQPPGRPAQPQPEHDMGAGVLKAVRDFLMHHPGTVRVRGSHRSYSDSFRRFVVGLFAPQAPASTLTVEQAADAVGVPLGTLKDWLRTPEPSSSTPPSTRPEPAPRSLDPFMQCAQPQIATLLTEFEAWEGDLSSFCEHARTELELPFGRGFITSVLVAAGLHVPTPRGAPHQAPWSRGSMHTPFPGAQWFGDGKQLRVVFAGQSLLFNIEAFVDGASNAVVAARVTDAEDAAAIIEAFEEALETTGGQPPLATTLDNRPSNFAPQIDEALSCTELLRATPRRGQAKAPVEGSFGLFEQCLPGAIVIEGATERDVARAIAQSIVHAFFLGRNGRPRGKLGGQSPAQAYDSNPPTEEQIQITKRWIGELRRREILARQSREQHADPVRLQLLREQLAALEIDDPQGQASLSLSGYSMGAILHGIAVFRSKREMGTLPRDCDPHRYLGGIIRNTEAREALERIAVQLFKLRLRTGELQLTPLHQRAETIRSSREAGAVVCDFVDAALAAPSMLAFRFWNEQAKEAMAALPASQAQPLFHHLARIIAASFNADRSWRERLIVSLAEAAAPVAA
jgi:transposase InsO family protein